jgi:ATP-dependent 26S proteasome regulatory subunit
MQTHLSKRGEAVAEDVTEKNLRELAFDTQKYSGAAIANLVNLAAMRVERDGRDQIRYQDLTDVSHCRKLCHVQNMLA